MKIKSLALLLGGLTALSSVAAPLTPREALTRAFGSGPAKVVSKIKGTPRPAFTAKADNGVSTAYVFNNAGGGYVIVSADDVAFPVLGYSDNGTFDADRMSPEMKWWLGEYSRQIEWAVANGASKALKAPSAPAEWTAISPLVKTTWDQDAPYNDDCPSPRNSTKKCVTGCVATSMAQVMNYHKYPEVGEGIKSYSASSLNRTLSINFANKSFDWDNMLNSYRKGEYTDAQAAAVAYLMKACGFSVEMDYTTVMSGAQGSEIAVALTKYFKYDKNIKDVRRLMYSAADWMKMVYENLRDVGPIVINGQSPLQGGHSFVCDGYDGHGYFHFNWGWSGLSDGYYALDALNPDAQGTGGAAGGFNFTQNAVLGIQPPTGKPEEPTLPLILQYGTTTASISGRTVTFDTEDYNPLGWGNAGNGAVNAVLGAIVTPVDGTAGNEISVLGSLGSLQSLQLTSMYSYYSNRNVHPTVELPQLADGTYRLTLASRDADNSSAQWYPVVTPWGCRNYCMLKVENGNYSVTDVPMACLSLSNLELKSQLYSARNATIGVKLTNNSELELCQGLCARLYDANGQLRFVGESILATVQPGETIESEWRTKFYNPKTGSLAAVTAPTEFTMRLYDPSSGLEYGDVEAKVTMGPNPGKATIQVTALSMPGMPRQVQYEYGDATIGSVTFVENPAKIPFDMSYKVTRGYFDGNITIAVYEADPERPNYRGMQLMQAYNEVNYLTAPDSRDLTLSIDFSQCEERKLYYLYASYVSGSAENYMGQIPFMYDSTQGVGSILDDEEAGEMEIFNLQGQRIAEPTAGQVVVVKRGTRTEKMVWK